jgi:hypothetical protein
MRDDSPWTDDEERKFQQMMRATRKQSPGTLKKGREQFAKVPLCWAQRAAAATETPQAYVWVWLMRLKYEHGSTTFPLPNDRLKRAGISRKTKWKALTKLEAAGLIQIERRGRKSPLVTLLFVE